MSKTAQPALTVDSLIKFQYKKKFSFANRSILSDNDNTIKQDSSNEEEIEDTEEKVKKKQNQTKGTAKLKKNKNSSSSFSASPSSNSDSSYDSVKKRKKNKKSKNNKNKNNNNDNQEDDERNNRKLKKLFSMFPHSSIEFIETIWLENDYNYKKCIDILLKHKGNNINEDSDDNNNNSFEIEEWSDGDEGIRARNLAEKKRKSSSKLNEEPAKKKPRKVIIASSDDENIRPLDEGSNGAKSTSSSNKISSLSSSLNDSTDKETKLKEQKKKKFLIVSDDEMDDDSSNLNKPKSKNTSDDSDSNRKNKKNKKHKKHKDKKKKSKNESDQSDQEDDDFDRMDADDNSSDSERDEEENLTDDQKRSILNLFNESSLEDFQSMLSASANRLKILLSLRPFKDYSDLNNRLKEKNLMPLILSAKEVIYARSIVNNLFTKCEQISKKMEARVASLIQSEDNSSSSTSSLEIKSQPKILNSALSLKPYQLIGLNWLCLLNRESLNGILADEMGLGKTCQTISFLGHLLETSKTKQLHLIVVPPSTLDNWIREITVWLPSLYFTVYQGSIEERKYIRFNVLNDKFEKPLNAIITTYNLLFSTNEDKSFFRKLKFDYCIYDEAHMLKNMNSIRYQSLIKLRSKRKILLTGTPMQNNLVELMSLLYFVMPDMFLNKTEYLVRIFKSKPSNVDVDTFYNEKVAQAKGIMKPFILRRLKSEVLKQMPKKTEEIIFCDMTQRQSKDYNSLIEYYKKRKDQLFKQMEEKAEREKQNKLKNSTKNKAQSVNEEIFDLLEDQEKVRKKADAKIKENEDSSNNILMELRKAANHPLLRRNHYDDEKLKKMARLVMTEQSPGTVYEYVLEDLSVMSDYQIHKICPMYKTLKDYTLDDKIILSSGKFVVLDSILQEKKELGDRVLIFSQFVIMLDILEDFLKIKNHKFIRLDGSTAVSERQDLIDLYNNDSEIFVFLLSTRAGGMGINLTAANVVILHDIDFNPFNDKQAEDRCHRVGQTKEVQVYKLISKNTIDENMLKIQQQKLTLGSDINGENDENKTKNDMVSLLKEALKI